jgi:hypothetical protein
MGDVKLPDDVERLIGNYGAAESMDALNAEDEGGRSTNKARGAKSALRQAIASALQAARCDALEEAATLAYDYIRDADDGVPLNCLSDETALRIRALAAKENANG